LKLIITIDGKAYEVDVEVAEDDRSPSLGPVPYYPASPAVVPSTPSPAPLPAPGAPAPPGNVDESKVCRSPIAGVVVRVNAQVGQQIQVNDTILVLEAMKMETNITAPVSGKIKAINAQPGDAVQAGQVLVEFE
jgi:methylmalonyl-CoA carboxyltransferase small subunit